MPLHDHHRIIVCLPPGTLFSWILRGVLRHYQALTDKSGMRLITTREHAGSQALLDQSHIAGVIGAWSDKGLLSQAAEMGIPTINISDRLEQYPITSVICDNVGVGRLAAQHLSECGYRRLLFARKAPSISYNQKRERGFREVATEQGIPLETRTYAGDVAAALSQVTTGTGIFIDNDLAAFNIIEYYREQGLSIPGDIGILGTDDANDICTLSHPRISSIATAGSAIGQRAMQLLVAAIRDGTALPRQEIIPPDGIEIRDSTDLIAVDDPILKKAVALMRKQACSTPGLSVDDIAEAVHTSRRVLEQRFRHHFNGTIYHEIRRIRIHTALQLLRQPDLSIQQVAQRSGFGGPDQCGHALRQVTGKGPRAWRDTYTRMGVLDPS